MHEIERITVHGRFQPPLHVNHWAYIKHGFELAEYVDILITNPFHDEAFEETASWRSDPSNNPFTYEERVNMFTDFLGAVGVDSGRYGFRPFNIKDEAAFAGLDQTVPNLVNVYSEWSAKKAQTFGEHGLTVIKLEQPKSKPVSGTIIRQIIAENSDRELLPELLIEAGFMQQAVPGLMKVLATRDTVG